MKVIAKGAYLPKTKRVKCHNCKSKLEYENSDIQKDRDGTHIVCPECGQFIGVDYIKTFESLKRKNPPCAPLFILYALIFILLLASVGLAVWLERGGPDLGNDKADSVIIKPNSKAQVIAIADSAVSVQAGPVDTLHSEITKVTLDTK